jgi:hypothetical protein
MESQFAALFVKVLKPVETVSGIAEDLASGLRS